MRVEDRKAAVSAYKKREVEGGIIEGQDRVVFFSCSRFDGESHVDQATAGQPPHAHECGECPHRVVWHGTSVLTSIAGAIPCRQFYPGDIVRRYRFR